MPDKHVITVRLKDQAPFDYEQKNSKFKKKGPVHTVLNDDLVSWMSPDGILTINFSPGHNPTNGDGNYMAPKGEPTGPVKVNGHLFEVFKYKVTINGKLDDPVIIMDDGQAFKHKHDLDAGDMDFEALERSAEKVLTTVVRTMKEANTAGESRRLFFPDGINLISVEIGPDKAVLDVAGPGASVREKSGT